MERGREMTCPYCNAEILNEAKTCKFCGADVTAKKSQVQASPEATLLQEAPSGLGMKWFKLQIYFLLFADALSLAAGGIINLNGGLSFGGIYSDFGILKPVDIIFGVIALGLAAFCIVTRFQLSKFKKNGPKLFYALSLAAFVRSSAYEIICLAVIAPTADVSVFSTVRNILIGVVAEFIYIVANKIYFDRRRNLFVN